MDREKARVVMTENFNRQPSQVEKNFEALFANEYFGDMVTEVFPQVIGCWPLYRSATMKACEPNILK